MGNEHAHVSLPCLKQKEEKRKTGGVDLCFSLIMRGKEFRLEEKMERISPARIKRQKKFVTGERKFREKSSKKRFFLLLYVGKLACKSAFHCYGRAIYLTGGNYAV